MTCGTSSFEEKEIRKRVEKLLTKGKVLDAISFTTTQRVKFTKIYEFYTVGEKRKHGLRLVHGFYDMEENKIVIRENKPLSYNV